MRGIKLIILTLILMLVPPGLALAHGLGVGEDIALPAWLSISGAAGAILLSFVMLALFGNLTLSPYAYPRADLLRNGMLRTVLTGRPLLVGLRLLSVALFSLIILSGLLGLQDPRVNFSPTFVLVLWWVGLSFFTAFLGNVWPLVNPWKVLFEWADAFARSLGARKGLQLGTPYPALLGVWPALALFVGFVWGETIFSDASRPANIALVALLYSVITWAGMVLFGKETWLQKGEAFSVYFGVLARFAPTEVRVTNPKLCEDCSSDCQIAERGCVNCYECFGRAAPEDRQLNLRSPAVGLGAAEPPSLSGFFFVVFVLTAGTYHGLVVTPLGARLHEFDTTRQTLGLLVVLLLFLALYLGIVKLSQLLGGRQLPFGRLAAAYVYSLVPIAIAYQVAHYFTLLLIGGLNMITLLSDPFGWGWDLFGTSFIQDDMIIRADPVWYFQTALIVSGHVFALYLAHVVALRSYGDPKHAVRSQYPMMALMILYTVLSLWLLSQPPVQDPEDRENGPSPARPLTRACRLRTNRARIPVLSRKRSGAKERCTARYISKQGGRTLCSTNVNRRRANAYWIGNADSRVAPGDSNAPR